MMKRIFFALLLCSLLCPSLLFAATFTVNVNDDRADPTPGDGVCGLPAFVLGGPWCSLRAAIQEANEIAGQDTIILSSETYTLLPVPDDETDDNLSVNGDLNIYDDLIIQGNGGVINGANLLRLMEIESASVEVSNLTFKNAASATDGGAIFAIASHLTIDAAYFEGNVAEADGGALFMLGGRLNISNTRFHNNTAGLSGGAIAIEDSHLALQTTTFFENYAEQGGAIYAALLSGLTVTETNFWANTAGHFGGGVMIDGVSLPNGSTHSGGAELDITLSMSQVNFGGNEAAGGAGGGVYVESLLSPVSQAALTIEECDFQDNGGYSGGAVAVYSGTVSFDHCNFVNNEATGEDGVGGAIFSSTTLSVLNTTLRENTSYFAGGAIYVDGDLHFTNSVAEDNDSIGDGEVLGEGLLYAGDLIRVDDSIDSDLDGIADINDNCPYTANPDQSNIGGTIVGAGDDYGDACQCGDVNNSGTVDNTDVVLIIRYVNSLPPGVDVSKCDVNGDILCDAADAAYIQQVLLGIEVNSLQHCAAAIPAIVAPSSVNVDPVDINIESSAEVIEENVPAMPVFALWLSAISLIVISISGSRRRHTRGG